MSKTRPGRRLSSASLLINLVLTLAVMAGMTAALLPGAA